MSRYKITLDIFIQEEHLTPTLALELIVNALARGGCFAVVPLGVVLEKEAVSD